MGEGCEVLPAATCKADSPCLTTQSNSRLLPPIPCAKGQLKRNKKHKPKELEHTFPQHQTVCKEESWSQVAQQRHIRTQSWPLWNSAAGKGFCRKRLLQLGSKPGPKTDDNRQALLKITAFWIRTQPVFHLKRNSQNL